ncbi:hypothetical protein [Streptomyces griseochromogenes]|uniref:hypothetical protein n=1 Tax=Streptomyces griseochromogenes TaxID=68214 RepID=UPI0037988F9E
MRNITGSAILITGGDHGTGREPAEEALKRRTERVYAGKGVPAAVHAVRRPHGSFAAGALVIAAGGYESTPVARHCREGPRSGPAFGLCRVGSCMGPMPLPAAPGLLNVVWTFAVAALVLARRQLPARAALDVPTAPAVVGPGPLTVVAPSAVPGPTPSK